MKAVYSPSDLHGAVDAIASKSDLHRLLFCAALADRPTRIIMNGPAVLSEDIKATVSCLEQLGANIRCIPGVFEISPVEYPADAPSFDCRESGSTLRFLLPVAAACSTSPSFTGSGRLPDRPVGDLLQALGENGISVSAPRLPFSFSGRLHPGTYTLPGNVSSQYITGLLLALPLLERDSDIVLTTELESASYVGITLHSLAQFGIQIEQTEHGWHVPGRQSYRSPRTVMADGDWSNASCFFLAGALGEKGVTVRDLHLDSPQGDKAVLELFRTFGAEVSLQTADGRVAVTVRPGELHGAEVDLTDIPDQLPVLAVLAACAEGKTVFSGAARLRLKESDRIAAVADMLHAFGVEAVEAPDGLTVTGTGGKPLHGAAVSSYNDHRIVMAASIAAAKADGETTLTGCEAVNKSYPTFFHDYLALGGIANVI